MSLIREHYETREEWLANRKYIGGSEAAAAIGISPFMSNVELWEYKTGRRKPKDLSGNSAVEYGNRLEPALRALYAAEHPEMIVDYHQYDILYQDDFLCASATLDGDLFETTTNRKGILEIKTVQCTRRAVWLAWKDKVPQYYYVQCLGQLIATNWDFVDLFAHMRKMDGDSENRLYRFEREDHKKSIVWLKDGLWRFWKDNVVAGVKPSLILPELL